MSTSVVALQITGDRERALEILAEGGRAPGARPHRARGRGPCPAVLRYRLRRRLRAGARRPGRHRRGLGRAHPAVPPQRQLTAGPSRPWTCLIVHPSGRSVGPVAKDPWVQLLAKARRALRASQAQGDLLHREVLLLRTMRDLAKARGCLPDGRLGDYFAADELAGPRPRRGPDPRSDRPALGAAPRRAALTLVQPAAKDLVCLRRIGRSRWSP